jgi:hypothetical protein
MLGCLFLALKMIHYLSPLVPYWRAILLLVAGMSLTPGRAAAECGDYLIIRNSADDKHRSSSITSINRITLNDFAKPTPVKLPCRGPNCSSSPARDNPVAPAIAVNINVKDVVQHSPQLDDETASNSTFPPDKTIHFPIHRTSSVFHPPRLD